jgi:hypothetical protein
MSRTGMRNIRSAIKSERAFHARWEKKQREKLQKQNGLHKATNEASKMGEARRAEETADGASADGAADASSRLKERTGTDR